MRHFLLLLMLVGTLASPTLAQQFPGGGFPGTNLPGMGNAGFPGAGGSFPGGGAGRPGGSGPGVGIDDSTKVIYGPKTVKFFLENDVFNNRKTLYLTDTALIGTHQFEFTQRNRNLLTDQGNLGTPLRPVFFNTPMQIGAQQGYYVFAPFGYQSDQVRYYDTKSPFTDLYLVLGGRNQNILTFDFNQNINPRLNVGFGVQRFTSERQAGVTGLTQTQRILAQNWSVLVHGNYRSKDERYTLLANVTHMNHQLPEQGGSRPTPATSASVVTPAFDYEGQALLEGTTGWERRVALHVYHQYAPAQGIQFFQKLDLQEQTNNFEDRTPVENQTLTPFYPTLPNSNTTIFRDNFNDTTRIWQDVYWRALDNTFGIKGIFTRGGSAFNYRAYYRQRLYSQQSDYNLPSLTATTGTDFTTMRRYGTSGFENYVGGWLGYYFPDSLSRLTAEGEVLLNNLAYRLNGQLESRYFTAGFTTLEATPSLIAQRFISNVRVLDWRNSFQKQGVRHAYGMLNVRYKDWLVKPGGDFWVLDNYIYYDSQARPAQSGTFTMLRLGLGADYSRARFRVTTQAYYTVRAGGDRDVLRVPTFFLNGRIQYDFIYAKVLHIQTGVELHYKSSYAGYAYMPVTQQYYLHDPNALPAAVREVEGTLLADVFANMRVNRVRFFVKFNHANMGLFGPGYYVAPRFPQLQRGFGFGVDWLLFD